MAERLKVGYLRKRLEIVGIEMGWNTEKTWAGSGTFRHSVRDAVFLQKGPGGGWSVVQYTNERGGERNLSGNHRLTARELDAWFAGIMFVRCGWH